jgi:hypothetical protein
LAKGKLAAMERNDALTSGMRETGWPRVRRNSIRSRLMPRTVDSSNGT